MNNTIHLTDNSIEGYLIEGKSVPDVLQIAKINQLKDAPELLIYPHSFSDLKDSIGDLSILTTSDHRYSSDSECLSLMAHTGNLMGFVGLNNTSFSIHSRFTHKKSNGQIDENGKDYFLYYMLEKVLSINIFCLKHFTNQDDKILDFLLFLFPYMLKKALSQGIYKEYRRKQFDDTHIKGTINVPRFIKKDIPFKGGVSYSSREHSYDNSLTQLIRHTIECIKHYPFGVEILNNDQETTDYISQIVIATPSYNERNRERVLNENLKPKVHPYFLNYKELQQLCIRILRHESLKYGKNQDKVYGVLFDGSWLWEEYLNTIFSDLGFNHPRNKESVGGIRMFEDNFDKNSRQIYPDFYSEDYILDAKYKHLNRDVSRDDLYQVISYMYCMNVPYGGFIYPDDSNQKTTKFKLAGKGLEYKESSGGVLSIIPLKIPQVSNNWEIFIQEIGESESKLKKIFYQAIND